MGGARLLFVFVVQFGGGVTHQSTTPGGNHGCCCFPACCCFFCCCRPECCILIPGVCVIPGCCCCCSTAGTPPRCLRRTKAMPVARSRPSSRPACERLLLPSERRRWGRRRVCTRNWKRIRERHPQGIDNSRTTTGDILQQVASLLVGSRVAGREQG